MKGASVSRREMLQGLAASVSYAALPRAVGAQTQGAAPIGPLRSDVLPAGIRSRFVENVNGLRMHVLEAGFEKTKRPRRCCSCMATPSWPTAGGG